MSGGDYVAHGELVSELLEQALMVEEEARAFCAGALKELELLYDGSDDASFLEALRRYEKAFLVASVATSRVNGLEDELTRTKLHLARLGIKTPLAEGAKA